MKQILFKPFEKFSALQLILSGLIFTVIGTWGATQFNGRYDGVLDFHIVQSCVRGQAIVDNLINILCLFIFIFLAGKIINPKTRLIDNLSTVIFARVPMYLLPFLNFEGVLPENFDPTNQTQLLAHITENLVPFIVTVVISLLFIVWYVALLYNGYKTASNAKGAKAIWIFIGALILAEISSKTLIYTFN